MQSNVYRLLISGSSLLQNVKLYYVKKDPFKKYKMS